jgi:hypothetical protein
MRIIIAQGVWNRTREIHRRENAFAATFRNVSQSIGGSAADDPRLHQTCFVSLGKILPLREIGFSTYLYRNVFHLSGDPACKSDAGALMQFDRRPMALPYPYGRRLQADYIHFCGRSLHQPTDVGLTMGNDLLKGRLQP